jgi:hypothetical protein
VRWINSSVLLLAAAAVFAGCNDPAAFRIDPILLTDTVTVAAPLPQNAALPTAVDITGDGLGNIRGGRFPERSRDALEWDFGVRVQGGELVLIPARGLGAEGSRAALSQALVGETFEGLREAPPARELTMDQPVVMRVGQVYGARSREFLGMMLGGGCFQYAKFQPLEVNVAAGLLRIQIVTNERCGDPRLVRVD